MVGFGTGATFSFEVVVFGTVSFWADATETVQSKYNKKARHGTTAHFTIRPK
jgi:hypothetical protein